MNYFHNLVLASLAFVAVSSRDHPSFVSSSSSTKGKRGLYDPVALASSGSPETLYRHQLEPYKSQDLYSRDQGQLYQRSVPHASQQQNLVGRPQQQYYQQEAEGGSPAGPNRYHSQAGPPPSSQVKYHSVKQHGSPIQYSNRPQIQYNIGKPGAEGFQSKHPYAKAPQFSQAPDVSSFNYQSPSASYGHESSYTTSYSGQDGGPPTQKNYQVQYQSQDAGTVPQNHQVQYQRPQQPPQSSKYHELAQKQLQEAINFQKSRLNQANAGFGPHHQPQYQYPVASEQHQQYSAPQHHHYTQDHEQQQSEQVPQSAQHFYQQYLQMLNKQGFIQAQSEGEEYQQQQYQNQEAQQSNLQESYARPTKYLASGHVINYKDSDLRGV